MNHHRTNRVSSKHFMDDITTTITYELPEDSPTFLSWRGWSSLIDNNTNITTDWTTGIHASPLCTFLEVLALWQEISPLRMICIQDWSLWGKELSQLLRIIFQNINQNHTFIYNTVQGLTKVFLIPSKFQTLSVAPVGWKTPKQAQARVYHYSKQICDGEVVKIEEKNRAGDRGRTGDLMALMDEREVYMLSLLSGNSGMGQWDDAQQPGVHADNRLSPKTAAKWWNPPGSGQQQRSKKRKASLSELNLLKEPLWSAVPQEAILASVVHAATPDCDEAWDAHGYM